MEETRMNPAVGLIDQLLAGGYLSSTMDEYIAQRITATGARSFYNTILKSDGRNDAENALSKWIGDCYLREFSSAIEPIARGMMDLAKADTEGEFVKIIKLKKNDELVFPLARKIGGGGKLIVAFNPPWNGCGCNMPEGAQAFISFGDLLFKAVVLGVSTKNEVTLGLVFDLRNKKQNSKDGYTVIEIERSGYSDNFDFSVVLNIDNFLYFSLGFVPIERITVQCQRSGGSMSNYLGFPDSDVYLARNIGKLGPYFSAMAKHTFEHKK